uniref:Uncharacterized protein n=1 Tax=Myotis myotis TaxID=51298 RepID=A0A7J7SC91_MYOMY|nr:hypothetical protein mMyoMyo1_009503 [Myotis myotis]
MSLDMFPPLQLLEEFEKVWHSLFAKCLEEFIHEAICPGIFFVGRFLINASIFLLVIFLFSLPVFHYLVLVGCIPNCQKLEATQCSSTGDWLTKVQYNHNVEYYSAIKRDFAMGAQCSVQIMLLSCTLETCMVLQANVTLINSIKSK